MARTTLAMVLAFFLLAGGVFALEKTQPRESADKTIYVLDVKDTDVQRLDVTTQAGATAFERAEPFGWKFAASGEQADLSRVSSVVNRLAKLRSSAKVTEVMADAGTYGLAPARDVATLTLKDGSTRRINIGNKTVNDAAYYAILDGTTALHTINTLVVGDLEKLVSEPPVPSPTPGGSPTAAPAGTGTPTPVAAAAPEGPELTETPLPTVGLPAVTTQ